ncbi:MAG: GNAT family N-acetyltransferase [Actinomycetota bacterium]|nr:GNAT family N-acetyltransferase [Actinomycetota bacterium]
MENPYWPLFGLRVRTPTVELRLPTDDDLIPLAGLGAASVDDLMFLVPAEPGQELGPYALERQMLAWAWKARGNWTPDAWRAHFCVVVDGVVCGTQSLMAEEFATRRTVMTGSWLGPEQRGRGLGKEMRAAALHLAFAGLGARRAESGARDTNYASLAVSRALGYVDNGDEIYANRRDRGLRGIRLVLTDAMWQPRRRDDIVIEGLDACLDMFGAGPAAP